MSERDRSAGATWCVSLTVPASSQALFETVLEGLGGALSSGEPATGDHPIRLQLHLSEKPNTDLLADLLSTAAEAAGVDVPEARVEELDPRDWVAESQAALPPIRSRRLWIHGSHVTEPRPAGCRSLLIEAAAAFGTGRHETTLGCLLTLERLAQSRRPRRILDMGCGSGILALAASRLWPGSRILGIDNDPVAVAVARGNAEVNGLGRRVRFRSSDGYRAGGLRGEGGFELVIANILARPLAVMAPGLRKALAPGGAAVLAGLLSSQERQVMAPHEALGLRLARRITLGDWSILLLRG